MLNLRVLGAVGATQTSTVAKKLAKALHRDKKVDCLDCDWITVADPLASDWILAYIIASIMAYIIASILALLSIVYRYTIDTLSILYRYSIDIVSEVRVSNAPIGI